RSGHNDCRTGSLTSINISNNTALEYLDCSYNSLTSLDVSNNPLLVTLDCACNRITSLDVSNNTLLIDLDCDRNYITNLDVSNSTSLTSLYCWENSLTSLDVSNNTVLTLLWCDNNSLTSLDVSKNTALTNLQCDNNSLISLDASNGNNINMSFYALNNPNLYCISVDDEAWADSSWIFKDPWADFSNNCCDTLGVYTTTACKSYTWIDGITYFATNKIATHRIIGGSVNGCDSIVQLNLTIVSVVQGVDIITACDSYTWIDGITYTSSNYSAVHTISGVAVNGCDSVVTLNLTISNSTMLNIDLGNDTVICENETILLDGSIPNGTFQWQDMSSDSTFSVSDQGTYWVEASNICGSVSDTVIVNVVPLPSINLGQDANICVGDSILLTATLDGALSYLWQSGETDSTLLVTTPGLYQVEVNYICGTISDSVLFSNSRNCFESIIPTLFSPNGDDINDTWEIDNIDYYEHVEVEIFNRWGSRVFYSVGYKEEWDGKYKGEDLPTAPYFYIIKLGNGTVPYTGSISIIR
ncbi:MAG: gliding motility-associated C-terminal domain-containing protein, partial [Bacteroidetes bacterium]|nr:gliding motility-associated C-terminal domain-containing protein [Bacteroidota bacterium]